MKEVRELTENSFIFETNNVERAVVLREMMYLRVKIFAPHAVIFHHSDSVLPEDQIAMLIGNLVIDNTLLDETVAEYRARINFTATFDNRRVTVGDIFMFDSSPNPFLYQDQLLTELKIGQKLFCDIIIRRNMYMDDKHAKWQPCNIVLFKKVEDGFLFSVETSGALPLKKIVREGIRALNNLGTDSRDLENTFFARPDNFAEVTI